jgi:signal peptidase I
VATVLAAGAVVGVIAAVTALGTRRVVVHGVSMHPLLQEGERVLVDRLAYWRRLPQRGDVVLLRGLRGDGPGMLLKRVVGLPGETITLARDRLHVDGAPLDLGRPVVGSSPGTWTLGPDELFVLSENLAVGTDSRHTGPVWRADLLGRVWLVYAPSVRRLAGRAPGPTDR